MEMKKIIVASNNAHKIIEIKQIMNGLPFQVVGLKEAGINIEVEETGDTFLENAYKKAIEIYEVVNNKDCMVLADDSGLSVDILGGAPGVYSARFAGEPSDSKKNNQKLLDMLKGKCFEDRKARFICGMVLIGLDESPIKVQGEIEGYILEEEKGRDGFGYDPLFYVTKSKKTFAEMDAGDKNSMSHRGRALEQLIKCINNSIKI